MRAAKLGALIAAAALLLAAPARAEVWLERMTWPEVAAALEAGARSVIIPTGGTEQNGRHLALGKHNVIVAHTAEKIATALGDTLIAPVIAYVPEGDPKTRDGHMGFAGTISLSKESFEALLTDAALSLETHGFTEVILLGDSGGNIAPMQAVAEALNGRWFGRRARVIALERYYAANGQREWLKEQGLSDEQIGPHAGIRDTSEALALDPGLIRQKAMGPQDFARDGGTGNSALASPQIGREMLHLKIEAALAEIRAAREVAN
ncbi:MAG: creatininase family protein [Neomegalonema sp.]|nr:creatininase family protein [Neomegalonema sp.]